MCIPALLCTWLLLLHTPDLLRTGVLLQVNTHTHTHTFSDRICGSGHMLSISLCFSVAPGNTKAAEAASSAFYNPSNPHSVYMPMVRHTHTLSLTDSRLMAVAIKSDLRNPGSVNIWHTVLQCDEHQTVSIYSYVAVAI